jgi:hypothetical protein
MKEERKMSRNKQGNEKSRPVFERRLGSIRVAVWQNAAPDGGVWWNISIVRRYRDGEEWKEAQTFNGLADLALVREAATLAGSWIAAQETATLASE